MSNSKVKSHSIKFTETNIAYFDSVAHTWIYAFLWSKFINAWEKLVHVQRKILYSDLFFFSIMSFTKNRPIMEWLTLNFCALACLNKVKILLKMNPFIDLFSGFFERIYKKWTLLQLFSKDFANIGSISP